MIISIDPGTYNTGIALIDEDKGTVKLVTIGNEMVGIFIKLFCDNIGLIESIIVGKNKQKEMFREVFALKPGRVTEMNEYNSTVEGRQVCVRYWAGRHNYLRAVSLFFNGSHCDAWAALVLYTRTISLPNDQILLKYRITELDPVKTDIEPLFL